MIHFVCGMSGVCVVSICKLSEANEVVIRRIIIRVIMITRIHLRLQVSQDALLRLHPLPELAVELRLD